MSTSSKHAKMHPLVVAAAVAIILVCLVGIAAMMGILPKFNKGAEAPAVAPTSAVAVTPAVPAAAPEPAAPPVEKKRPARRQSPPPAYNDEPTKRVASCSNCGVVESVRAIQNQAPPSGIGAAIGAVAGGVLGNQIGSGTGNTLATIAGAVGGGYAGNQIEKSRSVSTSYEVVVRMNDGSRQRFVMREARWQSGDLVRVEGGNLVPR